MILQLEHVSKSFGGRTLFADATIRLEEYDRLALVGPNGAGKTTLLRIEKAEEEWFLLNEELEEEMARQQANA